MKSFLFLILTAFLAAACTPSAERSGTATTASELRFVDKASANGIDFEHYAGYSKDKWMPEVLSGGVVAADFNRDGAPDLFFSNSGEFDVDKRPENASNRLYLNDGTGTFSDVSKEWNVHGTGYGQGAAAGDFDNDGLTDIFLTNVEGDNRLLRNTGNAFVDVTESAGFKNDGKWATSAGFGDFDMDGDLDLFVVRYIEYSKDSHQAVFQNRMPTYSAPFLYPGISDQVWRNDGEGKFTDVSEEWGIADAPQKGLALAIGDIDKDGDSDVYVANDTTPNQLWINDGTGRFTDAAGLSGSAYSEVGKEEGSMGADFSDFDGNTLVDIVVTNFQEETTALYSQEKPSLFREVSDRVGIGSTARSRLSFGVEFFDADNDGDEDIIMANGHIDDTIEKNSDSVTFAQPNTLYENTGDGKFLDVTEAGGPALEDKSVSRGLAVADFDSDGDLDYVIANNNGPAQLAFNETKGLGNFVGLLLEGVGTNRNAIGTRLVATIGEKKLEREVMGSQSYLSISDLRVLYGIGKAEKIDRLEVFWAGGGKQVVEDIPKGKYYLLKQGSAPVELLIGEKRAG